MSVSEQQVQDALKEITDHTTKKDFVSTKSVKNVKIDGDSYSVEHVVEGDSVAEVLAYMQYNRDDLVSRVRRAVDIAVRDKRLTAVESGRLMRRYEEGLEGYTYLSAEGA